ncbi:hypothetical protein C8R45DRAFT_952525 [Mycena sanguinolenta]|nr:hypothetical protein C8R45DRAFT_952525 [Mycena sanguinolenta]
MASTAMDLIVDGTTGGGSRKTRQKTSFGGSTGEEASRSHLTSVRGSSWIRSESRKFNLSISTVCIIIHSTPAIFPRNRVREASWLFCRSPILTGLNYLVEIDPEGRLRWARNHELVDTTAGRWKDSENGQGIIPDQVSLREALVRGSSAESTSTRDSAALDNAATHYAGPQRGKHKLTREFRKRFTLRGIMDRLLRKTVKRNTWIYVSHSSLISGGVVTSAGLISVHQGVVHTLSPLSGHYRTSIDARLLSDYLETLRSCSAQHFHRFIEVLKERKVDMTKARISKAEIALWGIEHIKRIQKSKRQIIADGKQTIGDTLQKVGDATGIISWKREVLEGRRKPPLDKERSEDSSQKPQGP